MHSHTIFAVDVSKDSLQIQTTAEAFDLCLDSQGLRKFISRLRKATPKALVVFEATGGYERPLLEALRKANIDMRILNPARVRDFARSEGIRAKTDPIDAKVILRFALEKRLEPFAPISADQQALCDLLDRRAHLTEQLAREKNRLQKAPKLTAPSIKKMIAYVKRQIDSIEKLIREHLSAHCNLAEQVRIFTTVQGVGELTAWTIVAFLSEIGSLRRNALVALAGLAPFNRDSGTTSKKRRITAGRAKVRRVLYMATQTAAQWNPHIKAYVEGLLARGKPYKCAIVAAMRKLLIHLQSLLRASAQNSTPISLVS